MLRPELILALLLPATVARAAVVDRIAAVVNDEVVTLSEIYELGSEFVAETCGEAPEPNCRFQVEVQVLESILQRKLVRQELVRLGYDVTAADVDALIQDVMRQYDFADREALREEVERSGIPWDTYREQLAEQRREQVFAETVLRARVTISEDELRDQYQRFVRTTGRPLIAEIDGFGWIVPDDHTEAQTAEKLAEFTALFETVRAGKLSWEQVISDYDSAGAAGLFASQSFQQGKLNEALSAVVFAGTVGEVQAPILAGPVLYGVRIKSRVEGEADVPPFEEAKEQLTEQLFMKKLGDAQQEWFEVAKRQAAIEVLITPGT